jgi:tetratricopeptide (TPR) repeat protein
MRVRVRALAGLHAVAWMCAVLAGACSSHDSAGSARSTGVSPRAPDGGALRPVPLPDLSQMEESVQKQIRDRYSSLAPRIENRGTAPVDLSNAYGEMGKLLMAAAKYPDVAESCFLNAQTLAPTDVRWPYYLGHLYRIKGDLAKSAALFAQALQLRPDDVATLVWLGDVHLAQGQAEEAEPLFAKALVLKPGSLSAQFGLGRAALARQDYRRAVVHLEEALALDPKAAGVHYPLAMAYRGLGESEKAEAHLRLRSDREIVPFDPLMLELDELVQSPVAYETRGIRALDKEDWAAAAASFRKGLELAPANPALRHRLGTALAMMGDVRGAREQFEEVVRVSPDYAKAHYSLGLLMEADGRRAEAIERFSIALRYEPNYPEARLRLAESLRRAGRAKESLPHYERLMTMSPRVAEAVFGYAMALVQVRRYQEARDRLTEGMKNYPDQLVFAHGLARLLAAAPDDRVRDGQHAMVLMQGLRKQAKTVELGETMAMTLAELSRYEEAAALQRDVMAAAEQEGINDLRRRRMSENLTLYEHREPCRLPWADGEIP